MTRKIVGIGAALAAAAALAGCGGSASTSAGTVGATATGGMTTSGVAGAQTTRGSVEVQVQGMHDDIQQAVNAIQNGDVAGMANAGGSIVRNCQDTLTNNVAPHATTTNEQQAVSRLRTACNDLSKSATKAAAGNTSAAKDLARTALDQAQQAVDAVNGM